MVTILYRTEAEKRQHSSAIDILARDLGIDEDSIRPFYENELRELQEHARIRTFLSILVDRKVREKIDNGLAYIPPSDLSITANKVGRAQLTKQHRA